MVLRIRDALRYSAKALKSTGMSRPVEEAEKILCHLIHRSRIYLYIDNDLALGENELHLLERMLIERAQGMPLQYITGRVGFYTCELLTDSRALIPRPDTETLIDIVIGLVKQQMNFRRIADVGTGSGNIAVVIARLLPRSEVWATDISKDAVFLARQNAVLNGVEGRIHFLVADLLEPFADGSLDLVVANPPYISEGEWSTLPREVKDHEPPLALRGGPEGLNVTGNLISMAFDRLSEDGVIVFEFGHNQQNRIMCLLTAAGYRGTEVHRDINGKPRVAVAFKRTGGRG